jgi:tRNA(His) guanylyltransferase
MRPDEFEQRMRELEWFHSLRFWQRRGTGLYWETFEREGYNPKLDQKVLTTRRQIKVDRELPMGEEYAEKIKRIMSAGLMR